MTVLVRPPDNIPAGNSGGTVARIPQGRRLEPGCQRVHALAPEIFRAADQFRSGIHPMAILYS